MFSWGNPYTQNTVYVYSCTGINIFIRLTMPYWQYEQILGCFVQCILT